MSEVAAAAKNGEQGSAKAAAGKHVYASAEAVLDFVQRLLVTHNVPAKDAMTVAECLVGADLRGVDTHGAVRLPGYLDRLRRGLINARPTIDVKHVTPMIAAVDGQNGFGFVVATRAMAEAIDMARQFGISMAGVRRSTHFGTAATYALQAIKAGFIGMVFTNASPGLPPWGSRTPLLGTSPMAIGAPGGAEAPFVLDMATTVVARGKIRKALRRGEPIPEGWALDAEGRPTTDPAKALEGVLLPIGGAKGSGIAMWMDIFGGVLTGAAFGGDVGDQYKVYDRAQNVGHIFIAIRPDLFVSAEEYRKRMDTLVQRIHNSPKAAGFSEVLVAGEPESRVEAQRRKTGIPYNASELVPLQEEAAKAGVLPLRLLG
jgi:LDH2 family malate/lactate/ureidoglycolate dehydrogenase